MPIVTTAKLHIGRDYEVLGGVHDCDRNKPEWWFCIEWLKTLWHIPKTATKFWLKASTSRLRCSYEMQLARDIAWKLNFRLAGEDGWHELLDNSVGINATFDRFGITDEPKTVWVQLLYE